MLRSPGTEAIVALEDRAPDVLFSTLPNTDIHLWPFLRMLLAQTIEELGMNAIPVSTSISRGDLISRIATGFLQHPFSGVRTVPNRSVLFLVNGTTHQQTPAGRRNWLVDDFATAYPDDSIILQDMPVSRSRRSPSYPTFVNTYNTDGLSSRIELSAKLSPLADSHQKFIRAFVYEIAEELEYSIPPHRLNTIAHSLIHRVTRIRQSDKNYDKILPRINPRIAVIEDASYGSHSSLIKMLKDRDALVVEPQHGWIGPSHAAYNFGAAMTTPPLKRYLPDVLLTFGEFWSGAIRHPAKIVAVGKPHLESSAEQAAEQGRQSKEVLVVSSVYDTDRIVQFTLALRDSLPEEWKVRLRPHPSERPFIRRLYSGLVDQHRVEFDEATDVYESLARTSAVFGFASTVLYEALAFDCAVFVFDSAIADLYVPTRIFGPRIADLAAIEGAAHSLTTRSEGETLPGEALSAIWKPHAVKNYRRFVDAVLGDSRSS